MWLALTLGGFVAFLASLFGAARRGFDANGHLLPTGRRLFACAALSLIVWLLALSRVPAPYPVENLERYELPK